MSSIFYCYACGHNLKHISGERLKCYGCGKYFAHSYDGGTVCRCGRKLPAFKFSVEIIAPNKGRCLCCKQEMEVVGNLEPPYLDVLAEEIAERGRGLSIVVVPFKTADPKKQRSFERELPDQEKWEIEFQYDIFDEADSFLIVGGLPFHRSIDDLMVEIENGLLSIKSLIPGIDFKMDFVLPEDVVPGSKKATIKNSVLEIYFQKKRSQT